MIDNFCTLCDQTFEESREGVLEIAALGPERRVHEACYRPMMADIREMGVWEFLIMVEAQEAEKGLVRVLEHKGPSKKTDEEAKAASQWFTPRDVAKKFAGWVAEGVAYRARILEPSSGGGALAEALADKDLEVDAWEIDPYWAEENGAKCCNFLEQAPDPTRPYSAVVMNPPYENDQDLEHVLHALTFSDRVFVLARLAFLEGVKRYNRLWSREGIRVGRLAIFTSRPKFTLGGVPQSMGAKYAYCGIQIEKSPKRTDEKIVWL